MKWLLPPLILLCPALWAQNNLAATPACPCNIFGTASPAKKTSGPDKPVEVGVRFTSDINSNIIAVRFYKMLGASGNHFGTVWSAGGNVLGTVQFQNETTSGWQTQNLPFPVPIIAGQMYTVSYHTDTGFEALDQNFFVTPFSSAPLHPISGVYSYNVIPKFPSVVVTTNYWVDVTIGNYVHLAWDASTTPDVLYNIYRSSTQNGQDLTKPLAFNLVGTTYNDLTVVSGQMYYYKVTATLQSAPSNETTAAIP